MLPSKNIAMEKKIEKLEMLGITKKFPGVLANDGIDITINQGEILGLLGENGAGKTTLMNILYGIYRPDSGKIIINGREVTFNSPADAIRCGIGMVHQHFMLVQNHTVVENITLGYEKAPFFFPVRYVKRELERLGKLYGLEVNPDAYIWQLSAGEQQRVEILKALFRGAELLILDEPTSVLTPTESEELFKTLHTMAKEGHSVIFISHKLEEVISLCNRVVVLRHGKVVGSADTKGVTKRELARMMVGRDIVFSIEREEIERGETVLEAANINVMGDRGILAVKNVSFHVRAGEIFGIAGVSGNGQQELVEAITGLRRVEEGSITVNGKDITNTSPGFLNSIGVSHIPEERIKHGTAPNLTVYENSVLKHQGRKEFCNVIFLNYSSIKRHARKIVDDFNVSTPSVEVPVKHLSGGNIQKLILGREISGKPSLLVAAHPTYGLDVGATEYIRSEILKLRRSRVAILLISEDLEELFELSDRIAVMFKGEIMGILERKDFNIEDIGMMMTGTRRSA